MRNPPTIKQQVATSEGHCRLEIPMMAWPDVQPPAYRVPKPTKKPPKTKNISPFTLKIFSTENKSAGINPENEVIPISLKSAMVFSAITISFGFERKNVATNPPIKIPKTNIKFQASFFQSYLKNEILAGKQAAQMCRSDDETPKDLFPINKSVGTVKPMSGPATYHGHGEVIISNIILKEYGIKMKNQE